MNRLSSNHVVSGDTMESFERLDMFMKMTGGTVQLCSHRTLPASLIFVPSYYYQIFMLLPHLSVVKVLYSSITSTIMSVYVTFTTYVIKNEQCEYNKVLKYNT